MDRSVSFFAVAFVLSFPAVVSTACAAPISVGDESQKAFTVPSAQSADSLLRAGNFATLDEQLSAVQRAYDNRVATDVDLRSAFRAFYTPDSKLMSQYDAWVAAFPKSYVARLARGIYYVHVGDLLRGKQLPVDTPDSRWAAASAAFEAAKSDLEASLPLEQRPLLSVLHLTSIAANQGTLAEKRRLLDASIAIDPYNYVVRAAYISAIETRWGGNQQMLKAFIEECRKAKLSRKQMAQLESVVAEDEGWIHQFVDHNYAASEEAYRKSAALGGDPQLPNLADVLMKQGKFSAEIQVLTQELEQRPKDLDVVANRGYAYMQVGDLAKSLADFITAAQAGNDYAQNELGVIYMTGLSGLVQPDPRVAVDWFRKSSAQGNSEALQNLSKAKALYPALVPK
jgi:tetratricopeptide (TPR) repeat protein